MNCCKDCKDRVVNCHSTCEKYKKWKQEFVNDKIKFRKHMRKYSDYFYR